MSGVLQGTHNLAQTITAIDGLPITGAADGDFITITYNADIYNTTVGGDGDYHRATSNDQGGDLVIRVMQTSVAARRLLSGILRRHRLGSAEKHTIAVTNLQTGEQIIATECYPTTPPTLTQAAEVSVREYTFKSPNIQEVS